MSNVYILFVDVGVQSVHATREKADKHLEIMKRVIPNKLVSLLDIRVEEYPLLGIK